MPRYKSNPGKAYPLGATYDGKGVNFALFSAQQHLAHISLRC